MRFLTYTLLAISFGCGLALGNAWSSREPRPVISYVYSTQCGHESPWHEAIEAAEVCVTFLKPVIEYEKVTGNKVEKVLTSKIEKVLTLDF